MRKELIPIARQRDDARQEIDQVLRVLPEYRTLEQVCLLASATRAFRRLDAALPPELRVIGGSTVVDVLKDGSTVVTVIDD